MLTKSWLASFDFGVLKGAVGCGTADALHTADTALSVCVFASLVDASAELCVIWVCLDKRECLYVCFSRSASPCFCGTTAKEYCECL